MSDNIVNQIMHANNFEFIAISEEPDEDGMILDLDVNTIYTKEYELRIKKKNTPYKNNFVQVSEAKLGDNEVECIVRCTKNSHEEGREYWVAYDLCGKLLGCNTVN